MLLQKPEPHIVLRCDNFSNKGCRYPGQGASPSRLLWASEQLQHQVDCLALFAICLEAGWLGNLRQGCREWLQIRCVTVVQVLDEIGVDVSAQMGSAPTKKVAAQQHAPSVQHEEENDNLTARLAALK